MAKERQVRPSMTAKLHGLDAVDGSRGYKKGPNGAAEGA